VSAADHPVRKICIIVSKGSLDGVYPALVLANGARMEGIQASLFFTFFGLAALAKATLADLKLATVGNPALNLAMPLMGLPATLAMPSLAGALPGVSALATRLMRREMDRHDLPTVPEFLETISDSGGRIYACRLAMDMFRLGREDLWERIDGVLSVGEFYEEAAGEGTHMLFV
jgi:peroxiredoxin family protein